jgi:hypothetical protein
MPYCGNCGSQVNPNEKFCGKCGAALNKPPVNAQPTPERLAYSPSSSPPPPPPPPPTQASIAQTPPAMQPAAQMSQMSSESTVGVILFRKPKSLGRYDTYTGVVTNQRLIFAQMTSEMLTAAAKQSREQAKAEGKGFWGQWAERNSHSKSSTLTSATKKTMRRRHHHLKTKMAYELKSALIFSI